MFGMRRMRAEMVAVVAGVVMAVVAGGGRANACSMVPWADRIDLAVAESRVVAIGHWTRTGDAEATLVVEESLRGTRPGVEFVTDNRWDAPYLGCGAWNPPRRRFSDGVQSLVLFQRKVDGLWQISWLGYAVADVPGDEGAPLTGGNGRATLADVRAAIREDSNRWFVPLATVGLVVAAGATVVGAARAGVRR